MRREPTCRYHPAKEADERLGELMLALSHRSGAMRPVDVDMAAWPGRCGGLRRAGDTAERNSVPPRAERGQPGERDERR